MCAMLLLLTIIIYDYYTYSLVVVTLRKKPVQLFWTPWKELDTYKLKKNTVDQLTSCQQKRGLLGIICIV